MFPGASRGRLHAKTAVIDRSLVFIGSMNLDPRSASKNTELGIIIESPELAKEVLRVIHISKLQSAYRLQLGADGQSLEWLTMDDDEGSGPDHGARHHVPFCVCRIFCCRRSSRKISYASFEFADALYRLGHHLRILPSSQRTVARPCTRSGCRRSISFAAGWVAHHLAQRRAQLFNMWSGVPPVEQADH